MATSHRKPSARPVLDATGDAIAALAPRVARLAKSPRMWAVTAIVAVLGMFYPQIVAVAQNGTAGITPHLRIAAWDANNPQAYADSVRKSIDEVWRKMAANSKEPIEIWQIPVVVLADEFGSCYAADPNTPAGRACHSTLFLVTGAVKALVAEQGPAAFAAWLAEEYSTHIFTRVGSDWQGTADALTVYNACMAGIYLGMVEHFGVVDQAFARQFMASFDFDSAIIGPKSPLKQEAMLNGHARRSTAACI